jgi:hypothetical protein
MPIRKSYFQRHRRKAIDEIHTFHAIYSKSSCLAHLISIMCENGQVDQLTHYSFIGLQGELERNLSFRARNSDPFSHPNYYKILYAYHMSKGDYRNGKSRPTSVVFSCANSRLLCDLNFSRYNHVPSSSENRGIIQPRW